MRYIKLTSKDIFVIKDAIDKNWDNNITSIHEDLSGYLWIFTKEHADITYKNILGTLLFKMIPDWNAYDSTKFERLKKSNCMDDESMVDLTLLFMPKIRSYFPPIYHKLQDLLPDNLKHEIILSKNVITTEDIINYFE